MSQPDGPEDTPLQAEMRRALDFDAPPRSRDPKLQRHFKERLEELLGAEIVAHLRDRAEPLWVDRVPLSNVLACEAHYADEREVPFTYTVQKARTQAAGAMLRRWAFRDPREPPPMDALVEVHELLDDLANGEDKLGAFVAGLSPGARADMAAGVLEVVHSFGEVWPSNCLPRQVQASSPLRANLLGGNLVLTYRVGFRFGQPRRQGGEVLSSVVLFDMRPGRAYEEEERYNRWYAALLDLFKSGIAPARVVTWYAESQEVIAEELDNDKLEAAVRRVAGGVTRMVELDMGAREPTINPGWRCSFCRLSESCGPGLGYLSSTSNA